MKSSKKKGKPMSKDNNMDMTGLFQNMGKLPDNIPGQIGMEGTVPDVTAAILAVQTAPKPSEQIQKQSTKKSAKKKSEADTRQSGKPDAPISVRIPDDMRVQLSALGRATGHSVSSIIVSAVSKYIASVKLSDTERMIYNALIQEPDTDK